MRFKLIYNYAPYLDADFTDAVHEWHNARYGLDSVVFLQLLSQRRRRRRLLLLLLLLLHDRRR